MLREIETKEALLRYIRGENVKIMIPCSVEGFEDSWKDMMPDTLKHLLGGIICFADITEDDLDLEAYGKARMDSYEPTIVYHEEPNEEINPVVAEGEKILDEWLEGPEPMTAEELYELKDKVDEIVHDALVEVEPVEEEPKEFKPRTIHKGNGPKPKGKPKREFDEVEALRLRKDGLSWNAIGQRLNVPYQTIYERLKDVKI